MLGISPEEAKARETIKGNTRGWYWTYLKKWLDQCIQGEQWDQASLILTLAIYGLILFPGPPRIITYGVVEMF